MIKPKLPELFSLLTFGIWNNDTVGYFKPERYHGFVYEVRDVDDEIIYIGKRTFTNGWKTYTTSSAIVNESLIEHGIEQYQFIIRSLHTNEDSMKFEERQLINSAKITNESLLNLN